LDRLGYEDIQTYRTTDVLDGKIATSQQIFILPLISSTYIENKIERICEQVKENPLLGIIKLSDVNLQDSYLATFNDFIYWPSSDNEFSYRMQRLCDVFDPPEYFSCDDDMPEDFISLNMIGRSPPFLHVLRNIRKISRYDAPVLIEGETGTGKELAARAIHYLGCRKDFPFIPINCGAIPDNLVENELFGHEKGAYTDAKSSQEGIIGLANHGTIFFDEVEAFSPKGQVVLLRFLQDQFYKPLGAGSSCQANVRIIAATNEKLSQLVERGLFRQDLFYRLNIVRIEMPSLLQRSEDIEVLTDHFLHKYKSQYNQPDKFLNPDSLQWLKRYGWPGNVRELENLLHREFLLADGPCIRLEAVQTIRQERRKSNMDRRQERYLKNKMQKSKAEVVRCFEKEYLTRLLDETDGNVTEAAKRAGKERRSLGKLIKKYGIDKTLLGRS